MTILIIDDQLQDQIDFELRKLGYRILHVLDARQAASIIQKFDPTLVLIGSGARCCNGMDLMADIQKRDANLPVLTYDSSIDGFVEGLLSVIKETVHDAVPLACEPVHQLCSDSVSRDNSRERRLIF